jgi:hypothetical protein
MQILRGRLLLSASDLVNFLECPHATYLDLRDLTDPVEIPERDAATVLIFEKDIEHEKRHSRHGASLSLGFQAKVSTLPNEPHTLGR